MLVLVGMTACVTEFTEGTAAVEFPCDPQDVGEQCIVNYRCVKYGKDVGEASCESEPRFVDAGIDGDGEPRLLKDRLTGNIWWAEAKPLTPPSIINPEVYCGDDFRFPTVDELRTTIDPVKCPSLEQFGACGLSENCALLAKSCYNIMAGPNADNNLCSCASAGTGATEFAAFTIANKTTLFTSTVVKGNCADCAASCGPDCVKQYWVLDVETREFLPARIGDLESMKVRCIKPANNP